MTRCLLFAIALLGPVASPSPFVPATQAEAFRLWWVYRGGGVYDVYQWYYALQMWIYQYTTVVFGRVI